MFPRCCSQWSDVDSIASICCQGSRMATSFDPCECESPSPDFSFFFAAQNKPSSVAMMLATVLLASPLKVHYQIILECPWLTDLLQPRPACDIFRMDFSLIVESWSGFLTFLFNQRLPFCCLFQVPKLATPTSLSKCAESGTTGL